jgi:hypothetical protein
VAERDFPGQSNKAGPDRKVSSGIETVERPGAQLMATVRQIASVITVIVFAVAVVYIPDMSVISRVALVAVAAIFGVVVIFESGSSSRRRRDHLAFWVVVPGIHEKDGGSGGFAAGRVERVAASVRAFLELNRISNKTRKAHSIFGENDGPSNSFFLETWGAELNVVAAQKQKKDDAVCVIVGPVGPDTETLLRKMMADLKRELERKLE